MPRSRSARCGSAIRWRSSVPLCAHAGSADGRSETFESDRVGEHRANQGSAGARTAVGDLSNLFASGPALRPCAITLSRTVRAMTATRSFPASCRSSTASRPKTDRGQSAGPEPADVGETVGKRRPVPSRAAGDRKHPDHGQAEYGVDQHVPESTSRRSPGTARAPKISQLIIEATAPDCSTK